jgi:glycyl-tRNA synthetase (class II)
MASKPADRMDTIVSLCKRRGLVFPSSEIYGGLRASWDYGPLGVELKNNVKRAWWRAVVQGREDVVGLDSCVILAREVWETSGHVNAFVDPLTECHVVPQALPRRPPRGGRGQAARERRLTCPTAATGHV